MEHIVKDELSAIYKYWIVWFTLGSQDIKLRYRRSAIGPFWLTISMAVTIYTMGFLYGHLFKLDLNRYFPYLASGIIGWTLISVILTESTSSFTDSEAYIRNQEGQISLFTMRLILRNIIVFLHNILVYLPIALFFHIGFGMCTFMLLPSLLLIIFNAFCWGSLLAVIGTRYRDFTQIINSLIQVIFFISPVLWMPSLLPEKYSWIVDLNPFNSFLSIIRKPMMNQFIGLHDIGMVLGVSVLGFMLYALAVKKYRYRIVFWI